MKGRYLKRNRTTEIFELGRRHLISVEGSEFQPTHVYDMDQDGELDVYGYYNTRNGKRWYGYSGADGSKLFEGQGGELFKQITQSKNALKQAKYFRPQRYQSFWAKGMADKPLYLEGFTNREEDDFINSEWDGKNTLIVEDKNARRITHPGIQMVLPLISNAQLLDTNDNGKWEVAGLRKGYFVRLETEFDFLKEPETAVKDTQEVKVKDDIPDILKSRKKSKKRKKRRRK